VTHLINHTAVLLDVVDKAGFPMVATLTDFFGVCFNCRLQTDAEPVCGGPDADRANCIRCYLRTVRRKGIPWLGAKWPHLATLGLRFMERLPIVRAHPYAELSRDLRRRPDVLAACYRKYRAVIAPTRFLRKAYTANGLSASCFDIRYGVDLPRDPKPARAKDQPIVFGFMGQVAYHKGVDLLIQAFTRLPRGKATLQIYGPEEAGDGFGAGLRRAAEGYSVYFRGPYAFEKTAEVLRDLDVLVIPSRWGENGPLVMLNALTMHTPVIVADVEGLTEFIDEGKSGFSFAMGSADSLEQAMQRFIRDPDLAARMSQTTDFPWTTRRMTEEVLKVYDYALNREAS